MFFEKGGDRLFYKSALYVKDVAVLKKYSDDKYKMTLHKCLRQPGFELEVKRHFKVNDSKLECNISRARSKIFEYAFCNPWEWFVNLTLDKEKYDRYNLKKYISDLVQWIRNYNRKFHINVSYLFIPEHHKDGAWHIHGFLMGLPDCHLSEFVSGRHPQKLIDAGYLNWEAYSSKFGFVSVGKVKNREASSKYITKYISKDMAKNNKDIGAHLYYCSNGLQKAEEIKRGSMYGDMNPDYQNEYVKVKWLNSLDEAEKLYNNSLL